MLRWTLTSIVSLIVSQSAISAEGGFDLQTVHGLIEAAVVMI